MIEVILFQKVAADNCAVIRRTAW